MSSTAPLPTRPSSGTPSRSFKVHTVAVPDIGDLVLQLPYPLTKRDASVLLQYILDQVESG